jgi:hypothetical protein
MEKEVKEFEKALKQANTVDWRRTPGAGGRAWELALELSGFLRLLEFSVFTLVYAWTTKSNYRCLLYWLWAAAIK